MNTYILGIFTYYLAALILHSLVNQLLISASAYPVQEIKILSVSFFMFDLAIGVGKSIVFMDLVSMYVLS